MTKFMQREVDYPDSEGRRWPGDMTYVERVAWAEMAVAQAAEIARANCGQPYFGAYCQ